jgi:hypothetical protein
VGVRKLAVTLLVAIGLLASTASASSRDRDRHGLGKLAQDRLTVSVPPGWHLVRGWLSDVVEPVPALAIGSFPARLSRRTCECGMPNITNLPRGGAFLFIWEYANLSKRALTDFPTRPSHFRIASAHPQRHVCAGPSDTFSFRAANRGLVADVYFGSRVPGRVRTELQLILGSLGSR